MPKSDWEKKIEKRTENIGFRSRLDSFREPSDYEKARALLIEQKHWEQTRSSWKENGGKGKTTFTVSPLDFKVIYLRKKESSLQMSLKRTAARKAYIETPMNAGNIDVTPYKQKTFIKKIKAFFTKEKGNDYTDSQISLMRRK